MSPPTDVSIDNVQTSSPLLHSPVNMDCDAPDTVAASPEPPDITRDHAIDDHEIDASQVESPSFGPPDITTVDHTQEHYADVSRTINHDEELLGLPEFRDVTDTNQSTDSEQNIADTVNNNTEYVNTVNFQTHTYSHSFKQGNVAGEDCNMSVDFNVSHPECSDGDLINQHRRNTTIEEEDSSTTTGTSESSPETYSVVVSNRHQHAVLGEIVTGSVPEDLEDADHETPESEQDDIDQSIMNTINAVASGIALSDGVNAEEENCNTTDILTGKRNTKRKKKPNSNDEKPVSNRKFKRKKKDKENKRTNEDNNETDALDDGSGAVDPKQEADKNEGDNDDADEKEEKGASSKLFKRRQIRKIQSLRKLDKETKAARKAEAERRKRQEEKQRQYNTYGDVGSSLATKDDEYEIQDEEKDRLTDDDDKGLTYKVPVISKCVLEYDGEQNVLVEVDGALVQKLKPHQVEAVQFMYNNCVESINRIDKKDNYGCILAHCMGLGKTLSVITLVHTLLSHERYTRMNTCLVVCPRNTILNWYREFDKWLSDLEFKIEVFEMTKLTSNKRRVEVLKSWQSSKETRKASVMIIGYEMYRNLLHGKKLYSSSKDFNYTDVFYETLANPGPDLVVCDEGHVLKNRKTGLSEVMRKISTKRRVILTGTPLQNNLQEYHCMVSFVKPGLLGTLKEFNNRFTNPITNGQCSDSTTKDVKVMQKRSHILHAMLDGCVQRKDYTVLRKFLPPKLEYVISVRLSQLQMELYETYLKPRLVQLRREKRSSLFRDFQNLARVWSHPWTMELNRQKEERREQLRQNRKRKSVTNMFDWSPHTVESPGSGISDAYSRGEMIYDENNESNMSPLVIGRIGGDTKEREDDSVESHSAYFGGGETTENILGRKDSTYSLVNSVAELHVANDDPGSRNTSSLANGCLSPLLKTYSPICTDQRNNASFRESLKCVSTNSIEDESDRLVIDEDSKDNHSNPCFYVGSDDSSDSGVTKQDGVFNTYQDNTLNSALTQYNSNDSVVEQQYRYVLKEESEDETPKEEHIEEKPTTYRNDYEEISDTEDADDAEVNDDSIVRKTVEKLTSLDGDIDIDEKTNTHQDQDSDSLFEAAVEYNKEWWTHIVNNIDLSCLELSGKLVLLFKILKKCEDIGDKLLVFSQSLLTLDVIEHYLKNNSKSTDTTSNKTNKPAKCDPANKTDVDNKAEDNALNEVHQGKSSWTKNVDYFRMDGSTNPQQRKQAQDTFNDIENHRARLFLISTKAGALGINLVAANRVVILDASWNPSHDIQAIFRAYRFGQTKPVYVYRLIAQGTMEEKIYDRQVTKQSLSQRVVDEQQIDSHYTAADLMELYSFTPDRLDDPYRTERPLPNIPQDRMLAELHTTEGDWIVTFHEHDSLLENKPEQELSEEEKRAAWDEFNGVRSKDTESSGSSLATYMGLEDTDTHEPERISDWQSYNDNDQDVIYQGTSLPQNLDDNASPIDLSQNYGRVTTTPSSQIVLPRDFQNKVRSPYTVNTPWYNDFNPRAPMSPSSRLAAMSPSSMLAGYNSHTDGEGQHTRNYTLDQPNSIHDNNQQGNNTMEYDFEGLEELLSALAGTDDFKEMLEQQHVQEPPGETLLEAAGGQYYASGLDTSYNTMSDIMDTNLPLKKRRIFDVDSLSTPDSPTTSVGSTGFETGDTVVFDNESTT